MSILREVNMQKKTINKEITLKGVGIHSGKPVGLTLRPSFSGKVLFRRTGRDRPALPVDPRKAEAQNSTTLVFGELRIRTVEHLMAALFGLGVDSVIIELNGDEIPALDGSALPFVQALSEAGLKFLSAEKKAVKIIRPLLVEEKRASISASPGSGFVVRCAIEFDHPAIQRQELKLEINPRSFSEGIAPARTFGFLRDAPRLREQGMALGGSLANAIVLDDQGVINGPLRFPDEFVRHKILDFIGDLALFGSPFIGHFKVHCAGHGLHLKALRHLLDHPDCWSYSSDDVLE